MSLLVASGLAFAQQPPDSSPPPDEEQQQAPPANGGWRRVGDPPPSQPVYSSQQNRSADPGYPDGRNSAPNQQRGPSDYRPDYRRDYTVPSQLTIKPGTFVTVRVNQWLSSDRNQAGDAFSASLVRPIVVDGVVVAQRGQTVGGRVTEAQKAGRVEGVSRLAVQLTDLSLVDGQQLPIQSQMISRTGGTSQGRDAVGIGTTTAVGAAAGAAAGGGVGAGIGAGAGAVAGVIGVLLTRGHPTMIYPESVLTFRVDAPVTFSTDRSQQAFRYVEPDEYDRPGYAEDRPRQPMTACAGYDCAPPPYYGPGYYGPGYYPYYYGSGFGLYYGPSFYFGRGYYGRGYGYGYFGGGRYGGAGHFGGGRYGGGHSGGGGHHR